MFGSGLAFRQTSAVGCEKANKRRKCFERDPAIYSRHGRSGNSLTSLYGFFIHVWSLRFFYTYASPVVRRRSCRTISRPSSFLSTSSSISSRPLSVPPSSSLSGVGAHAPRRRTPSGPKSTSAQSPASLESSLFYSVSFSIFRFLTMMIRRGSVQSSARE